MKSTAFVAEWLPCCRAKVRFEKIIRAAQDNICAAVTEIDGKSFHEDAWTRPDGGGGISRVLQVTPASARISHCARCRITVVLCAPDQKVAVDSGTQALA